RGVRRGLAGAGVQVGQNVLRYGKILPDGVGQPVHRVRDILFADVFDFQGHLAIALEIPQGRVNTNLITEFGILPPDHSVGAGPVGDVVHHRGVDGSVGRDAQVG